MPRRIVRSPRDSISAAAPLFALVLAACTCAGKPGENPAPSSGPLEVLKPRVVEAPPPSPAPERPAVAPPPAPAKVAAPAPSKAARDGGVPAPAVAKLPPGVDPFEAKHKEHQKTCERFIESVGAAGANRALFESPEMKRIASRGRMLGQFLSCRAIALGDASRCELSDEPEDRMKCQERFERFQVLKSGGNDKRWLFTDAEYNRCKTLPMAAACDAFRDATRAGDPNRCPKGDYEAYCRALFTLDVAQCRGSGPNAVGIKELCIEAVDEKAHSQNGLRALARSGTLIEQMYARAALGEPDACENFTLLLGDTCTKSLDQTDRPVLSKN